MSYNYLFKVIVTGEQNSGKTSLVRRISDDNFRDYTDTTIGVEFVSVEREIGGQRIKYHFWDTAGQESFAPIIKNYYLDMSLNLWQLMNYFQLKQLLYLQLRNFHLNV